MPVEGTREQPVGRELELEAIDGFLADRAALPAILAVEGPAGQGKTTLWREALARAAVAGYRVLSCRPAGAEVNLLFGGLADLLGDAAVPLLPRLPTPQRHAMEVVLLLDDEDGSADPRAVSAGVLALVRELVQESPLLIAVDDVQWLDPASAAVLEHVARRVGDAPVAWLTARRVTSGEGPTGDAAVPRGPELERALERPSRRIALGPLSVGALHRILRTRAGVSFARPLLRRIHEASGGNPFYALEIARAMPPAADGWSTDEPIALSASLNELLVGRFAALDDRGRGALFVVASASSPTLEMVERVIAAPAREALQSAIDASLVRIAGSAIDFSHPLLAAVARSLPGSEERRAWHARMADAEADPEARARHLALSRVGPDARVARQLHAAAEHARSRGAPAAAGELYADAVRRLPDDAVDRRAEWTVDALPLLRQAGDLRLARSLAERAIAELPPGPRRSDVLLALSRLVGSDPGGGASELGLIGQALEEAGSDATRRAAALLNREMWERHQDRLEAALPFAREALGLAERVGDHRLLAAALTRTADLEVLLGIASDPVAHFERALTEGSDVHQDAYADSAPAMLAACLIRHGRVDEARELLVATHREAVAIGDEASLETISLFLAELEWLAGDWTAARGHADDGMLVAEQAESRVMQGAIGAVRALVDACQGRTDAARSRATAALAICEDVGDRSYAVYARQVLAFLELSLADAPAALRHLDAVDAERGIEGTKRISFVADRIEALVLTGDVDEAARLTHALELRARELHRPTLALMAARCRGLVQGASGDLESAATSVQEAVVRAEALGLPFERARSLLVLGDIQRRAKQRAAARTTLDQAIAAFRALGAPLWVARAEDSRARVGGRARSEGLTATEQQVATLVALGLTNREVAAELYVSVRAVEANLSKIYAKLGVRSRTELANLL